MYAADNGNTDVVKFLLENKADINAMDGYGKILKNATSPGHQPSCVRL